MRREELCERRVFRWGNENEKYPSLSAIVQETQVHFVLPPHAIPPQTTALVTTNDATVPTSDAVRSKPRAWLIAPTP